jgi:hypothetical protein
VLINQLGDAFSEPRIAIQKNTLKSAPFSLKNRAKTGKNRPNLHGNQPAIKDLVTHRADLAVGGRPMLSNHSIATLKKLPESEARTLLADLGLQSALRAFDADCARRFASERLDAGDLRATIRDRLVCRFRISPRSAYRVIDKVIQDRGNRARTAMCLAR